MSDFVVWARVRRQIEAMLVGEKWGRCSKGKFLEGSKRDSREGRFGRERAAKRTHEVTILADSSLFEAANYMILSLLLQEKRSWQFRLLSILHYLATSIFIKVARFLSTATCPKKAKLTLSEWIEILGKAVSFGQF